MALLEVNDLSVRLQTQRGPAYAVRNVSFSLERGETLGLIGESGCGKSITVMSLMGLLPDNALVTGSIRFDGDELVGKKDAQLCRIRGDRIGMIFQEPMTALNPVHSIGRQVAEPLRLHRGMTAAQARKETIVLLDRVGVMFGGSDPSTTVMSDPDAPTATAYLAASETPTEPASRSARAQASASSPAFSMAPMPSLGRDHQTDTCPVGLTLTPRSAPACTVPSG